MAVAVPVADPLPVELPVAVPVPVPEAEGDPVAVAAALPLSVELPVAVADGDPVTVATPLSDDWGEPDEADDNVAIGEEELDSLYKGLPDAAVVGDLVRRGDGEPVTESVFVFELVKDCDGLDECVGVLEFVEEALTDVETLGDLLAPLLRV